MSSQGNIARAGGTRVLLAGVCFALVLCGVSAADVVIYLEPAEVVAAPGETVRFDVLIASDGPYAVRGVQVDMPCVADGGLLGAVEFVPGTMRVDNTPPNGPDWVFNDCWVDPACSVFAAINQGSCPSSGPRFASAVASAADSAVIGPDSGRVYLGSIEYVVSCPDASGEFYLAPLGDDSLPWSTLGATIQVVDEPNSILSSIPPDGAIDARQPSELDGSDPTGWNSIELEFIGPTDCLIPAEFQITQVGGEGPPPEVLAVAATGPQSVSLTFSSRIAVGAWTTITHLDGDTSVRIGYLPADVNGDAVSSPADILALIDALNGAATLPAHATDVDRSGDSNPADILRLIDLLNGAGAFDAFNGATLP